MSSMDEEEDYVMVNDNFIEHGNELFKVDEATLNSAETQFRHLLTVSTCFSTITELRDKLKNLHSVIFSFDANFAKLKNEVSQNSNDKQTELLENVYKYFLALLKSNVASFNQCSLILRSSVKALELLKSELFGKNEKTNEIETNKSKIASLLNELEANARLFLAIYSSSNEQNNNLSVAQLEYV